MRIYRRIGRVRDRAQNLIQHALTPLRNRKNLRQLRHDTDLKLEIGPGPQRIPGFKSLNIVPGPQVDFVYDAAKPLPFPDDTFNLVYTSHILEHIPWYQTETVLHEWVRILKPAGTLKIWVPDGLKIAEAFVMAEKEGDSRWLEDNWFRFNPDKDPCVWAAGRMFTYGDGTGEPNHPNWHRAMFSRRHLQSMMMSAGLEDIQATRRDEILGHDHDWINLGLRGRKPSN